jgi:hypothetical protein
MNEPTPMTPEQQAMRHRMNCPASQMGDSEPCTCGLQWRDEIDRLRAAVQLAAEVESDYALRLARVTAENAELRRGLELALRYGEMSNKKRAPLAAILARTSQAPAAPEGERG